MGCRGNAGHVAAVCAAWQRAKCTLGISCYDASTLFAKLNRKKKVGRSKPLPKWFVIVTVLQFILRHLIFINFYLFEQGYA